MEYKMKPLNLEVNGVDEVNFPELKDRIIEMRGQVIEITLSGLEKTQEQRLKRIKELEAKIELENAKMVNIEGFHPFVKEMSQQDLHTAYLYREAQATKIGCEQEVIKLKDWMDSDNKEIKEIYKQIPELNPVIQEANNIIKNDKKRKRTRS